MRNIQYNFAKMLLICAFIANVSCNFDNIYSEAKCDVPGICKGIVLSELPVNEKDECLFECKMNSECSWFSFARIKGKCCLFATCPSINDNSYFESGQKECPLSVVCDPGWTQIDSIRFAFESFGSSGKNCEESVKYCQNLQARLFEPRDIDTHAKVWSTFAAKFGRSGAFLGMKRDPLNLDEWIYESSGLPIEVNIWSADEPNSHSETCADWFHGDGRWNDWSCGSKHLFAVCERPSN